MLVLQYFYINNVLPVLTSIHIYNYVSFERCILQHQHILEEVGQITTIILWCRDADTFCATRTYSVQQGHILNLNLPTGTSLKLEVLNVNRDILKCNTDIIFTHPLSHPLCRVTIYVFENMNTLDNQDINVYDKCVLLNEYVYQGISI